MSHILDGKLIAEKIRAQVHMDVERLKREIGLRPGLGVILVGEDPASQVYVKSKEAACKELGIDSVSFRLGGHITEADLLTVVNDLNQRHDVHGILVQLPLPKHIDSHKILEAVSPDKDVDGFHPVSMGRLFAGNHTIAPCTPAGIIEMLKLSGIAMEGQHAVVVGRSNIVGKPMAVLLLEQHATVTICHSRTKNLSEVCRSADILVAAIGKPHYVTGNFVKEGAVVIDVGVNRVDANFLGEDLLGQVPRFASDIEKKGYTLVGDVAFHEVAPKASHITPVPGGVGPLTIAMLMKNTVALADKSGRW